MTIFHVAALYKFIPVSSPHNLKERLLPGMRERGISGTIICAPEGVNGTVAGSRSALDWLVQELAENTGLSCADVKWSTAAQQPFKRCKFKIKDEIVTLRAGTVDAVKETGEFVSPTQWNEIIKNPDIVVIDTRNIYETEIGTFKNAVDPGTESFTDFPAYVEQHLNPEINKEVAMFCTGGIRCEKASAYMRRQGFEKVYQLHGGILKYLEEIPAENSLWQGECFVFDDRVTVTHGLQEGEAHMCYGCGFPVTAKGQKDPAYEEGVCCARCHDMHSEERKTVLRERHTRISAERILKKAAS